MKIYHSLIEESLFLTQKTFRLLLQAMSNPGKIYSLGFELESGFISVVQTLLDHEVTFNVVGHRTKEWTQTIIQTTGSKPVNIENADFVLILSDYSDGEILRARRGSLEYPDTGATVIYSINSLSSMDNGGVRVTLKGPGINGKISLFMEGIKKDEFYNLKEINSEYPLGVDSIFIDSDNMIMCIPRSTHIEVV